MFTLNQEQKQIVADTQRAKLVISGPGTGKTTTVTHFLAGLLATGKAEPDQILAVTFTVKAAREMQTRVRELTGQMPDVSTIHSFARRILRAYPPPGFTSDFAILDEKQEWRLIRGLLDRMKLNMHAQTVKEVLALARNTRDTAMLAKHNLTKLYKAYMQELKQRNAMDFDALLNWSVWTFENNAEALAYYCKKYRYILVDEFQDTSKLQYALLLPLARKTGNLLCVGDYDQSIYRFRGADVNLILNLEKDFPGLATHYLKQNYRSTQRIVKAANSLILNNRNRRPKPHLTQRPEGDMVLRKSCPDPNGEAEYVAQEILAARKSSNAHWSDFAVLYRINSLSIPITRALTAEKIPYKIVGDQDYFDLPEIKNILCFFRLIQEPDNSEVRGDAISVLHNLGQARDSLTGLMDKLTALQELDAIYNTILDETRMLAELKRNTSQQGLRAMENVEALESVLADFQGKGLKEFLDFTRQARSDAADDAVNLLTIHKAKGLEFDTVFVIGVDDKMIPHYQSGSIEEIEEERRMLYVAITRAKNVLHLTYPRKRPGRGKDFPTQPSRFLAELKLEEPSRSKVTTGSIAAYTLAGPDHRAEAEASRKANPQGPWKDSSGNRWGICRSCGTFTRDWWSLDGKTNTCECNDCKYK